MVSAVDDPAAGVHPLIRSFADAGLGMGARPSAVAARQIVIQFCLQGMGKKATDPLDELRAIKRKLSRELQTARKKGKLLEKLREIERRTSHLHRPRKRAHSR